MPRYKLLNIQIYSTNFLTGFRSDLSIAWQSNLRLWTLVYAQIRFCALRYVRHEPICFFSMWDNNDGDAFHGGKKIIWVTTIFLRQYFYIAQLTMHIYTCNWKQRRCLLQDWSRSSRLRVHVWMRRAALSNDSVRSDTVITNNKD